MADRSVKRKTEGSTSASTGSTSQAKYRSFVGKLRAHMVAKERHHAEAIQFERNVAKLEAYEDMQARIINHFTLEKSKIEADLQAWEKKGVVEVPPLDWSEIGEDDLEG